MFDINLLLICVTLQCVVRFSALRMTYVKQQHVIACWVVNVNDTPNLQHQKDPNTARLQQSGWYCVLHCVCNLGMSGTFSLCNRVFSIVSMFKVFFNLTYKNKCEK